jgi:hypothetical protein
MGEQMEYPIFPLYEMHSEFLSFGYLEIMSIRIPGRV